MHLLVDILNVHSSLLHNYRHSESHTLLMEKNRFISNFPCLLSNLAKIQFKGFEHRLWSIYEFHKIRRRKGHTFLMSVNNVSTCTTPQCLPLTPPISTCTTPQCLALTPLISTRTTTQCLNLKNLSNIISFRLHILTA